MSEAAQARDVPLPTRIQQFLSTLTPAQRVTYLNIEAEIIAQVAHEHENEN